MFFTIKILLCITHIMIILDKIIIYIFIHVHKSCTTIIINIIIIFVVINTKW